MLADLMTIEENFGRLEGLNFVFMGDGRNNVAHSLMIACAKMGVNYTVCAPEELFPADDLVARAKEIASESGSTVTLTDNVEEGTKGAHTIYTDIWVSMGEPEEMWETRIKLLKPFQVTKAVMDRADPDAIFLHCLPSFHDLNTKIGNEINEKYGIPEMEVTDEVFSSPQSKVFDEAENRMHTIKAVMYATLR
jgi:ornithine carbamoyltransferase